MANDTRARVAQRLLDAVPGAIVVIDQCLALRFRSAAAAEFMGLHHDSSRLGDLDLASSEIPDVSRFIHPDDLDQVLADYMRLLGDPDLHQIATTMRLLNPDGPRAVQAFLVDHRDDPAIAGIVVSFKDLTGELTAWAEAESKQALIDQNAALHAELLERQDFQSRLLHIQQTISRRMPLTDVLRAVVDGATALLDDELVELHLREPDGGVTVVTLTAGRFDPSARLAVALAVRRAAQERDQLVATSGPGVVADTPTSSSMAVPIRDRFRTVGALAVGTALDRSPYTELEREMLVNLAEHASVAIMDARTVEYAEAAMRDALTGLPTRALFLDRLAQSVERCSRAGITLTLMFIDLSRFKAINDSYGHALGDEVLSVVAQRIAGSLRTSDTAARLGGDEFVVLLEGREKTASVVVAQRILMAIRRPITIGARTLYADAAIGISFAAAASRIEPELLLRQADIAMYQARRHGPGSRASPRRCSPPSWCATSSRWPCAGRSTINRWRSFSNRSSICRRTGWSAWKRSPAGTTPSEAGSPPTCSSPSPRTRG
ncbi:MAG: sensor domain-containing diguanylate cyclase [Ilumatobacteraceae bacterium]